MRGGLAALCASHGIEPFYVGIDGRERAVPERTLATLAGLFGLDAPAPAPPAGIAEALAERGAPRCHVTHGLGRRRAWGVTCQLPGLASARNLGMGDFADLAALCRLAGAEGADFVGVNPLNALFWSAPDRVSPFFPSNRRFLNPLHLAPEWIAGFKGLTPQESVQAARLRSTALIDVPALAGLTVAVLRRLFAGFPWTAARRAAFRAFCAEGGAALEAHALFEAISEVMVAGGNGGGHGAGWTGWPAPLRDRGSAGSRAFAAEHRARVDWHLWLQWQADAQLARVQRAARAAGMRIGLYLDMAVGAAPDGSAAWAAPEITVPGVSIGAPPDDFSTSGQDWGLAPLSPVGLAGADARPFAETIAAVMRHAGALRIDHAMSLARLWLIPRGAPATEGAYVRYPLSLLLARLAEASRAARCAVIGEDLGVVPEGFRALMARRRIHAYKVFFFEADKAGMGFLRRWPRDALACVATHDMPTLAGWWEGADLALRRDLGMLSAAEWGARSTARAAERRALVRRFGTRMAATVSPKLHAAVAGNRCRLMALQIEDALGVIEQVNVPGTVDEHPNWRRRLPVTLERLGEHPGWRAHVAALRRARPR
ncbi:MAG TPA: 4-alpha-glucanotransferase [Thermohalobaculum sp.]|nr:4-alpha-glucanotransferase [Thermohalobaculum sp.]